MVWAAPAAHHGFYCTAGELKLPAFLLSHPPSGQWSVVGVHWSHSVQTTPPIHSKLNIFNARMRPQKLTKSCPNGRLEESTINSCPSNEPDSVVLDGNLPSPDHTLTSATCTA